MATDANMTNTATRASSEITNDLYPFLRKYKDGRIERLIRETFLPASEAPGANGVATRDVLIDPGTGVSARLFLSPGTVTSCTKLPVVIYFHGGGFCTGSAFSKVYHRYAASLSARAGAIVVSVEYRLAPEHPIPAAFHDAWAALQWVTTLSDPWLGCHGDRNRIFLAGDSAGANIAHNVVARAASPEGDDIDIEGMILLQPFFWGPDRLPQEINNDRRQREMLFVPEKLDMFWPFLTGGMAGNGDPRVDPPVEVVASLPCRRALVAVASKDLARHRGRRYASWLRDYGEWCREVTVVESEEDHAFHLYRPKRATAVELMDRVVEFIHRTTDPAPPNSTVLYEPVLKWHKAPACCRAALANLSSNRIVRVTPRPVAVGPGKAASVPRFGGPVMRPVKIMYCKL